MGGFFAVASRKDCVSDLFYGTDYHSHLGTRRGGLAILGTNGITRGIHNIENDPFRSKFEEDLHKFKGTMGIGAISDTDSQPILINSHLGQYGIVTVAKINNMQALIEQAFRVRSDVCHRHSSCVSPQRRDALAAVAALWPEMPDPS